MSKKRHSLTYVRFLPMVKREGKMYRRDLEMSAEKIHMK